MDDTKPKVDTVEPKEPIGAGVTEHPISEADAKKFAGAGDFSLPTQESPLDSLIGETKETEKKSATMAQPQPKSQPQPQPQPVVQPPTPAQPVPTNVDTKDLEKKAKDMLKDLGKTEGGSDSPPPVKPKKRGSGAATKMALAAVLIVMMGAGGVVGMNLLKMNQVADIRQQAFNRQTYNRDGKITCYEDRQTQQGEIQFEVEVVENPFCEEMSCPGGIPESTRSDAATYTTTYRITNSNSNFYTMTLKKNSNYCVNDPCGQQESDGTVCWDSGREEDVTLELAPGETKEVTVSRESDVGQSCGSYQTDIHEIEVVGKECAGFVASSVCQTGNTCPSGDYRPNMCEDVVPGDPDASLLQPGQSLSVTAKSNQPASRFQLSFYNMQNQDSGGPKPFIIDGSHYAMLSPVIDPMVEEYTFTVNYADIHKPDENWGDQIPSSVVYYAYFFDADGNFSSNVAECHGTINFGSTPPPTTTPEEISCVSLQSSPTSLETGEQVTLTCTGSGSGIHHYEFQYQIGGGSWVRVPVANVTGNTARLTPTAAGSYTAQCRVCEDASDCQAWEQVNPDDN